MATFRHWVAAEQLLSTCELTAFKKSCLAFDAEDYLDNLLTATLTREPLLPALGGLPFALQKHVDEDLQNLKDAGIKPIFVFNGLSAASIDGKMREREAKRASKILDDAWRIYDQGRGEEAVNAFGKACTYKTSHILRWLFAHLHQQGITVRTAPYCAAAQLIHLLQDGFCDGIVASAAPLVFGADKVITSLDFSAGTVSWVDSATCQGKTMFTLDAFSDLLLLSGCVPQLLPPLINPVNMESFEIGVLRGILTQQFRGDGHAFLLTQGQNPATRDPEYLTAFQQAKAFLRFPVYTTTTGQVITKNQEHAPGDVHAFTGQRLPDELYHYLARGVCGPRVLDWSAHRQSLELPPLDGGMSAAYRDVVENKLMPQRVKALSAMAVNLNRYFQHAPFESKAWFDAPGKGREVTAREGFEEAKAVMAGWHVPSATLGEAWSKSGRGVLGKGLALLSSPEQAKKTITERKSGTSVMLSQPVELLANTTLRFLQDAGYVNAADHSLSSWGTALQAALEEGQRNGFLAETESEEGDVEEGEEAIFLAFELLRLRMLNTEDMFAVPPYSGGPIRGSSQDKANTLLISRVCTLARFHHRSIGYTGPLSRHLLAYHQLASSVRESARDLIDSHAAALLLSGAVDRLAVGQLKMSEFGSSLPFTREPDLGLSLVVKSWLDEMCKAIGGTTGQERHDVSGWFNYVVDFDADLQRAWGLWGAVNAGVQAAGTIVPEGTKRMFRGADEWLKKKISDAEQEKGLPA
ncbi:hypothetical protein LTR15_001293 [Elasticomyces elasticus]|nr:hypothetical protein LTR15_001293 [Elasticomyces elasticus]